MRRAAKRDENEPDIVDGLLDAGCTVTKLSQDGVLDLLVGHRGRFCLMEVKSENGRLKPKQETFIKYHSGCPIFVVRTRLEALGALKEI
jgi:hypothetical protein